MNKFLKLLLAVAGSALLGACASTQPTAVFNAPSVSPVKHAVTQAEKHVSNARSVVTKIEKDCPQSKKEIEWLNSELKQSYDYLEQAQVSIESLKGQIKSETDTANHISGQLAKVQAHDTLTTAKYHRVKLFGSITFGFIVMVLAWAIGRLFPPYGYIVACASGPLASVIYNMVL